MRILNWFIGQCHSDLAYTFVLYISNCTAHLIEPRMCMLISFTVVRLIAMLPVHCRVLSLMKSEGYSVWTFPTCTKALVTEFPYRTFLSLVIGPWRVYPSLKYIKVHTHSEISPSVKSLFLWWNVCERHPYNELVTSRVHNNKSI